MSFLQFYFYFLLTIFLASCATVPPTNTNIPDINEDGIRSEEEILIFSLLQQANASSSPESEFFSFEAAEIYLGMGQERRAFELLTTLNTRQLELKLAAKILLLRAQYLVAYARHQEALNILTIERFDAAPQLPLELQKQLRSMRAQSYKALNNHAAVLRERILLDPILNLEEKNKNHEEIWQNLLAHPIEELRQLAEAEIIYTF